MGAYSTKGFDYVWHETPICVTFESNWQKAKSLLTEIINRQNDQLGQQAQQHVHRLNDKYPVHYSKLTPIVYTKVQENGVLLTVRYLSEPRRRRGHEQALWEEVLRTFAQHDDITFAYPTQRFVDVPAQHSTS